MAACRADRAGGRVLRMDAPGDRFHPAAAIMHASYNALFFFVLFAQRRELPHMW